MSDVGASIGGMDTPHGFELMEVSIGPYKPGDEKYGVYPVRLTGAPPPPYELTQQERRLIGLTANFWNLYCKLPNRHPSEEQEVASIIHALQRVVMSRPTARVHPETFPNG